MSPAASTCVEACPGAQGGAQVLHHLSHQLSLSEVRGPHLQYGTVQYSAVSTVQYRLVPAHECEQCGPAPAPSLGAVVVGDVDGAGADQLPTEASLPPVRMVVV